MHLNTPSVFARDCGITCPSTPPVCACATNQQCVIIAQSCSACSFAQCVSSGTTNSSSSGGVSKGALAGGVVGVLIFLGASIGLFLCYRRRSRNQFQGPKTPSVKKDIPANAATVLSRPDPIEKSIHSVSAPPSEASVVRVFSATSHSTINLDPEAALAYTRSSIQSNPFTDTHSIQTASDSTQSTNVIPIALVPHGSVASPPRSPSSEHSPSIGAPARPARSPDLNIRMDPVSAAFNLEHVNVSNDSFRPPHMPYANSQASGFTNNSSRESYMTSGSFASDVLMEAPQIVTPASGAIRQVLGVARAEVIRAPGSLPASPLAQQGLRPNPASRISRPPVRSPLAQTAFRTSTAYSDSDTKSQTQEVTVVPNPFGDEHDLPTKTNSSPAASVTTFGLPSPQARASAGPQHESDISSTHLSASSSDWVTRTWQNGTESRPASGSTHGSLHVGAGPSSPMPTPLRTGGSAAVNGAMPSPAITSDEREWSLAEQQEQAIAYARQRAAASGLGPAVRNSSASSGSSGGAMLGRRVSGSSVASAGGDSLLESFTFVPPSPISSRPPRSPLAQSAFSPSTPTTPQSMMQAQSQAQLGVRHEHAMSTASGTSALEGYTFRIDSGSGLGAVAERGSGSGSFPPSAMQNADGRMRNAQRASLDTLALTQDLSAFPLNFDQGGRDSFGPAR